MFAGCSEMSEVGHIDGLVASEMKSFFLLNNCWECGGLAMNALEGLLSCPLPNTYQ